MLPLSVAEMRDFGSFERLGLRLLRRRAIQYRLASVRKVQSVRKPPMLVIDSLIKKMAWFSAINGDSATWSHPIILRNLQQHENPSTCRGCLSRDPELRSSLILSAPLCSLAPTLVRRFGGP